MSLFMGGPRTLEGLVSGQGDDTQRVFSYEVLMKQETE